MYRDQLDIPRQCFVQLLELKTAEEVSRFLDDACEGDTTFRAEIEDLLAHHDGGWQLPRWNGRKGPQPGQTMHRGRLSVPISCSNGSAKEAWGSSMSLGRPNRFAEKSH